MEANELKGKVQTVLGLVDPVKLGLTLPHEHLFIDVRSGWRETQGKQEKYYDKQVDFTNLYWVRSNTQCSKDNLILDDEKVAILETMRFKEIGGGTIVDVTPKNLGRNAVGLLNVSIATGLNIVMGTAYYFESTMGPEMDERTEQDIANEFVGEMTLGVGKKLVKAGIIGELGCSWPLGKKEIKVLRAAALAQQQTGAVISVHPGFNEKAPFEIIDILTDAGAKPERIIIGHISLAFPIEADRARLDLAGRGCYLEWDLFGTDGLYPQLPSPYDVPNDVSCIKQIIKLAAEGYLGRILISHDTGNKVRLTSYGGNGFLLIPEVIVPLMLKRGLTQNQVHTLTVENPVSALTCR